MTKDHKEGLKDYGNHSSGGSGRVVLCDAGFEGLLTGLYWAFKLKAENLWVSEHYRPTLFEEPAYFPSTEDIAEGMRLRIEKRFGNEVVEKLYWSSLSEVEDLGPAWMRFFKEAGKYKGSVLGAAFLDGALYELVRYGSMVQREHHRLLGLVRFKEVSPQVFFSAVRPVYNILGPLSQHFAERLSDQRWILFDEGRGRAVFYTIDAMWEAPLEISEGLVGEDNFEGYWQTYYNAIAIEARINEKRRQGFMPKRYWSNLTELKH